MHLASDYIHPYKDAGGPPSHCRVRIYLPDDDLDAPVVVCSELPNNPGGSVTNSAEAIAAGVIRANELPTPLVWIEHWPEETTEGQETFESGRLLQLRGYGEGTLPWGDQGMDRDATWKGLDRATVEILSDGKVLEGFLVGNQDLGRLDALLDHFNIFEATGWYWRWLRGRGAPRNTGSSKD